MSGDLTLEGAANRIRERERRILWRQNQRSLDAGLVAPPAYHLGFEFASVEFECVYGGIAESDGIVCGFGIRRDFFSRARSEPRGFDLLRSSARARRGWPARNLRKMNLDGFFARSGSSSGNERVSRGLARRFLARTGRLLFRELTLTGAAAAAADISGAGSVDLRPQIWIFACKQLRGEVFRFWRWRAGVSYRRIAGRSADRAGRRERECGALKAHIWLIAVTVAFVLVATGASSAGKKILPAPKFFAGQSLRYRIQTRTSTKGTTTTPIKNPEGGSETNLATRLVVRLDVLRVSGTPATAPTARQAPAEIGAEDARVRATYEVSEASAESDAVNPGASSPGDQYKRIEGHSIEFTIGPGGGLADFQGLDEIFANRSDAEPMVSWVRGLTSSAGFPKHGIEIGQKWTNERQLDGMPLTGLVWRTQATYLRDEACNSSDSGGANPAAPGRACAHGCGAKRNVCRDFDEIRN